MAIDEKAAARLRAVLAKRRDITEKKMMGALCFMAGGTMCCGITGDALMIRVGPENFDKALTRPHVRPLKIGKRVARGFVLIDPPGLSHRSGAGEMGRARSRRGESARARPQKRPAAKRPRAVK